MKVGWWGVALYRIDHPGSSTIFYNIYTLPRLYDQSSDVSLFFFPNLQLQWGCSTKKGHKLKISLKSNFLLIFKNGFCMILSLLERSTSWFCFIVIYFSHNPLESRCKLKLWENFETFLCKLILKSLTFSVIHS